VAVAERTRVLLHIGAPKTGTTYLQDVLSANREALAAAGVLYPRVGKVAHHISVWDLRGKYVGKPQEAKFAGKWDLLAQRAQAWSGHTVVVSSELLVFCTAAEARRAIASFGDLEVHLVYTARDLMRQVPAVWQEQVKNRRSVGYDAFLNDVLGRRRKRISQHFWEAQDAAAALERWAGDLVPAERVHVVTAPPSGAPPETLWLRFAEVLGVPGGEYVTDIPMANESLGVTSAELLRRFAERHAREEILEWRSQVMRQLLPALVQAVPDRDRLPLTDDQESKIVAESKALSTRLEAAGYDVVGSLADLVPQPRRRSWGRSKPRRPDELSDRELLEASLDVLDHVLRQRAQTPEAGS
jgi:hypothetical protein